MPLGPNDSALKRGWSRISRRRKKRSKEDLTSQVQVEDPELVHDSHSRNILSNDEKKGYVYFLILEEILLDCLNPFQVIGDEQRRHKPT
ncbi:unnamed protein product [Dracunculus medinensis]|uniref:Uncharacterized protein n=1 Tax=Dracunculus medinensis TaxID=318479 RepID=A0A0N4UPL5_DRAME|nr:unnamed protein product [Dracunculus medinensis]